MPIRKHFIALIILLFNIQIAVSQHKNFNLDSLYEVYTQYPNAKDKVKKLIYLSRKDYLNQRPDILENALDIATKIYYTDGIAEIYDLKGLKERRKNNFSKAVEFHKRALGFFEKTKDTFAKVNCLHNLGVSLRKLDFNDESYRYYLQALNLAQASHNNKMIAYIYNGIGNVYVNTEEYDKALFFFKKAYDMEKVNNNLRGQDYNIVNIGEVFIYQNKLDSASVYLNKALDLEKIIYKPKDLGIIYNLLGQLNKRKKEFIKSIYYYEQSIPPLKQKNIQRYIANSLINMGNCKMELNKHNLALLDINEGMKVAQKINSVENISLAYKALVDLYVKKNDYKKAFQYNKKATEFHAKVVNQKMKQSILTNQVVYETKQKDKKIKKLAFEKEQEVINSKRNKIRMIIVSVLSLLIISFLFFFFKLKRKNADLELEQKNSEIQNYIMKIQNLKNCEDSSKEFSKKDVKEKLSKLDLTPREIDVLELISEGFNNEEISEKMYISKNTVKSHIKNIYIKLDVKNRAQAIKKLHL